MNQSYWVMFAAAAGAATGVGSEAAYNKLIPQQTQQPVIEQLHADIAGLRQDLAQRDVSAADQTATLHNMWQIMARAESAREAQQAKAQAAENRITNDFRAFMKAAPK